MRKKGGARSSGGGFSPPSDASERIRAFRPRHLFPFSSLTRLRCSERQRGGYSIFFLTPTTKDRLLVTLVRCQ
jgi:hypothetical protein